MKIPTTTILTTKRLSLRYPALDDSAQILSVVTSAQFPERLPLKELATEIQIRDWLKRLQQGWATDQAYSWILEDRSSGFIVGQVTLSRLAGANLWALAFWIHPDQWGKGYATEGVERVSTFGFETLMAEKIWAGAGDWNRASCQVLEKTGMNYVGDHPKGYIYKGEPVRTREYEISRETWQKISKKR